MTFLWQERHLGSPDSQEFLEYYVVNHQKMMSVILYINFMGE